ncbi:MULTISPECIES: hypothetical protein [Deinococcus]|uniref:Apea-like HEPN domain-containing protein n=1 Tax=Deinococcus rufus TaxID=2136097 RepID=A0ABV7Z972_9DEIO|nr:hypothetical protein [Deinococcus sp. AB2017081]WQE94977.1 hypothetical protein U2P90_16535 [Deinococcus sp. AB2017081]
MTQPHLRGNRRVPNVDFTLYDRLHPYGRELILAWFRKAVDGIASGQGDSFESFMYTWLSLNAWAACVTDEDSDSLWQAAIGRNEELSRNFILLMNNDEDFRQSVTQFYGHWPIFQVKSIRERYPRYFRFDQQSTREEMRGVLLRARVRHDPWPWNPTAAVEWGSVVSVLSRVRNNLFHGQKSPYDASDQEIVRASLNVLVLYIAKTNLYGIYNIKEILTKLEGGE